MADDKPDDVVTILGIPIRVDATLCDAHEVWLEAANGTVTLVVPPPAGQVDDE